MTNAEIAERLDDLVAAGNDVDAAIAITVDEICREQVGCTPAQGREDVLRALDLIEAQRFNLLHPEWKGGAENGRRLWDRACEIAGNLHPVLSDLETGYFELLQQGQGAFDPIDDEPEPAPPAQQPPSTPPGITKPGRTRVLATDPATRAKVADLSLAELKRKVRAERWANIDPARAARLKQGFEAL